MIDRLKIALPIWLFVIVCTIGCAGLVRGLRAAGDCAPPLLAGVTDAIRTGGQDWVGIVAGALQCVPAAIRAIDGAEALDRAHNAPSVELPERMRQRERKDTALQLWRLAKF